MKVLIVEDDRPSSMLLEMLIKSFNADIEIKKASDGVEGVALFEESLAEGNKYDIIFLDIMMPNKDGQETLTDIRKIEKDRGILGQDGVKIVMTTALEEPEQILTAFREQCEAYIVKPINKENLFHTIKNLGY